MDAYARTWGYKDMERAVGYAGDPDPQFNAEGVTIKAWRSAVWRTGYGLLAQHLNDTVPPTYEEIIAQLPPPPARPVVA
jgi:hypothetical protein